jgi:hypothetical protein
MAANDASDPVSIKFGIEEIAGFRALPAAIAVATCNRWFATLNGTIA